MTRTDRNDITAVQDGPEQIEVLRARDRVYRYAKVWQGVYVALTLALGVIGVGSSSALKPYFGLAGIVLLLLEVLFLERHLKQLCKLGARLGEDFDLAVLKLPRNTFVSDQAVSAEDLHKYGCDLLEPERERQLRGWYEAAVAHVPLRAGRLVCQRVNLSYDANLRIKYARWLLITVTVLVLLVMFAAIPLEMTWSDLVLALSAALPALSWVLRERSKNLDVADQLAKLQAEVERLWMRALADAPDEELDAGSRQLQDAIYRHRASTTLIFGWVYARLRPKNEEAMASVVRRLVDEFNRGSAGGPEGPAGTRLPQANSFVS